MKSDIKKCVARAIVNHLDGDMDKFKEFTTKAMELYKRDKHLYVSIEDILRVKGDIA